MKRHIAYLRYVLRHKYFVFIAARKCRCSFWRALVHDWHKFLPSEWGPYARTFYKPDGSWQYEPDKDFAYAWNLHQKRGKHHWQHWLLRWDSNCKTEALDMSWPYIREMVADWYGAGRAITGKWGAHEWYWKNNAKMQLSDCTRVRVQSLLREVAPRFGEAFTPAPPSRLSCLSCSNRGDYRL